MSSTNDESQSTSQFLGPRTRRHMPKAGRARSPYRWVRRLLLLVGLLSVAGIAVLLMAYQFGKGTSTSREAELGESGVDPTTLTSGQSFDYTQWTDGRRIFRIQADRSRQDRDDTAFLETVVLDIFRQEEDSADGAGESTYTVTSRQARVNQSNWSAHLEGDVVISGWGNVELEARVLELMDGGQVLESVGAVAFRYAPDLVGRATRLRIDRRNGTVRLEDGVHIKSVEGAEIPLRLDCQRLVFRREEGLLRALDDVTLEVGDRRLSSRSLTLFLDDDLRSLEQLIARWDVRAEQRPSDPLSDEPELRLSADLFEMSPDEKNPELRRLFLRGEERVARVTMVDREGLARRLTGLTLDGILRDGELEWIEGWGSPLVMEEFLDLPEPHPLRRACAQRAIARFDGGELRQIQLEQQVDLGDTEVHLSGGERAVMDLVSGKIDIHGPTVELLSDRGDLVARRFDYNRETGFIRASGGVRGSLASGGAITLATTPFGRGQGPLQVESEEAIFSGEPRGFVFKGGVRAWRDTNLLITQQLRGDEAAEQLAASGGVKTVWTPTGELAGRRPIEVTAERLTWDRARDQLVYDDSVRIVQGLRSLTCDQTVVELARGGEGEEGEEEARAERMICRGGVELRDATDGQQVAGDLAVYTLPLEIVEVFGETVQLVDAQSNVLKGRYLLYDLAAGSVQLRSQPPAGSVLEGGQK